MLCTYICVTFIVLLSLQSKWPSGPFAFNKVNDQNKLIVNYWQKFNASSLIEKTSFLQLLFVRGLSILSTQLT